MEELKNASKREAWSMYPTLLAPLSFMSTRCTILLSRFISTSLLHVSVNYVPIITRAHCICATRQPPIQSEKYQCRTDTVSSPDDGHIVARNM